MRLPPEIILEIFAVVLDSPLLHIYPPCGQPYEFYSTMPDPYAVKEEWHTIEKLRGTLRGVCKEWNTLTAGFAGRIVYSMRFGSAANFAATLVKITPSCQFLCCELPWDAAWPHLVQRVAARQPDGTPLRIRILSFVDLHSPSEIPVSISDLAAALPFLESLTLQWSGTIDMGPFPFGKLSQSLPRLRNLEIWAVFSQSPPLTLPLLECLTLQNKTRRAWEWDSQGWILPSLRCLWLGSKQEETKDLCSITHLTRRVEHFNVGYMYRTEGCDFFRDLPCLWELICYREFPFDLAFIPPLSALRRVVFRCGRFRDVSWRIVHGLHLRGISVHFTHVSFKEPFHNTHDWAPPIAAEVREWEEAMEAPLSPGGGIFDMNGLAIDFKIARS